MVQVPILSGIVAAGVDFQSAYPVNLIPVPKKSGISEGYLRPAEGIVQRAVLPGLDRGGYEWRGVHYRVAGNSFVSIASDGTVTEIGTVNGANYCAFAESFDRLAINGGDKLYYWNETAFTQVTDVDLGVVKDVVWIDGYFMTTDGEFLITTEISDPTSVNPLKYGSSEISPDPVTRLVKIRNEVYAVNRNTVEIFDNVGGSGFPFQRIEGAQIMKGGVGRRAACEFMTALAMVGGGKNEAVAVWLATAGSAQKLSTRDVDRVLRQYSETQLSKVVLESRVDLGHEWLYIHLPDQTLVYDGNASAAIGQPVWFFLRSPDGRYRAWGHVWVYGEWACGDPTEARCGVLVDDTGAHYGDRVNWEFTTPIVYGEGVGAIVHELELVALTGNVALTDNPQIATSHSIDGETWSPPAYIAAGLFGQRGKKLAWRRQGAFRNWRVQRFTGDSRAHLSFARLECEVEALSV